VYQRKDGRWVGTLDLGWQDGKRVRKPFYGKTDREVKSKLNKAINNLADGIAPGDDRITLTDCLTRYLDDMEARKAIAHGTLVKYRGILRNYIIPAMGRLKISQMQPHHIRTYQTMLISKGASTSTITSHRALLSGGLGQATADGLIPRNVVPIVKPPKDDSEPIGRALLPEHAHALLAAIRDDPLAVFYLLLLTAGLRRGEALGLCWEDVELGDDNRPSVIHLKRQLQWPDGVPTLVPLKSKRSTRSIPIPAVTTLALLERRQAAGNGTCELGNLVLTTPDGESVHRNTIGSQFNNTLKRAGLPHYRPHDLRHTYGSLLMSQGVPLKTISDLLGHASIEVTANVYLHSLEGQVLDTADAMTRALGAPAGVPLACVCPVCGRGH
jgi:integrase